MSASNTTAAACQAVRRLVVGEVPMAVTSLMGGSREGFRSGIMRRNGRARESFPRTGHLFVR